VVGGAEIELSPLEFDLLNTLARSRIVTVRKKGYRLR